LKLEVPLSVILPDGTNADVKGVAAKVIDRQLAQIVYTVEKETGAWTDMAAEEIHPQDSRANDIAPPGDELFRSIMAAAPQQAS
jgi:hypothetical protein